MENKIKHIQNRDVQDVLDVLGGRWRGTILASLCDKQKLFLFTYRENTFCFWIPINIFFESSCNETDSKTHITRVVFKRTRNNYFSCCFIVSEFISVSFLYSKDIRISCIMYISHIRLL